MKYLCYYVIVLFDLEQAVPQELRVVHLKPLQREWRRRVQPVEILSGRPRRVVSLFRNPKDANSSCGRCGWRNRPVPECGRSQPPDPGRRPWRPCRWSGSNTLKFFPITMEVFSRRRWATGSAQQSNNNGIIPCMCWVFFLGGGVNINTTAFCLGRSSLHLQLLKRAPLHK